MSQTIAIIGGGAAGFFAAITAARRNPDNTYYLFEAGQRPLTKVLISGGGRCNVTHACFDIKKLVLNYPRGAKELIGPFHRFGPQEICQWFADEGVELVAEADGRMFPRSNKSQTIAGTLLHAAEKAGVQLFKGCKVREILKEGSEFVLHFAQREPLRVHKLVLTTGSAPQGFAFAEALGHRIVPPQPSLFTFTISDAFLTDLPGQSVPRVAAELSFAPELKLPRYSQQGALLITHWGLSGPAILRLSAFAARSLATSNYQGRLLINWLPGYTPQSCREFLEQFRQNNPQKSLAHPPLEVFSKRLWQQFISLYTELLPAETLWRTLARKTLQLLAEKLTAHEFSVEEKGVFKEEFVTAGGVERREINFATMESKITPGLYFAGEIIDIDGVTGGFNFQNAWTTAWLAGEHIGVKTAILASS